MKINERIVRNPDVCSGQPVFTSTRVTLRTVLADLAVGESVESISEAYPSLTSEEVWAVIAFAAATAEEDIPLPDIPSL